MTTLDMDRLRSVFHQEAEDTLAAMEQSLLELEEHPDQPAPLNDVFRHAHTIKGSAAMVGAAELAAYAHTVEDALDLMRQGALPVTSERITLLLQIVDSVRGMLAAEARGIPVHVRSADAALVERLVSGAVAPRDTQSPESDPLHPDDHEHPDAPKAARTKSLRVDMRKLDALLSLSGEITVARGLMASDDDRQRDVRSSAAEEMDRLLGELHEHVMEMRLVPLGPVFRQHSRTVRDIASAQGKLVRLEIEGEDVEVDASIVEQLRDPITHLVRNAVDHGVEFAADRQKNGKDPCATVVLHARHERGVVVVEVRDDGQGLNRARIAAKARERGLLRDTDNISDNQLFGLAMLPGFSTADRVTEVSGRGVGMDIVKRNVEAVRGTIEIASQEGAGTTVRLRLPLTVAIIDGFVVGVGDERYVIPLDVVTECLTLPAADSSQRDGVLWLRGDAVPHVRLRHLLGLTHIASAQRESVVVVQDGDRVAGLVVDHLFGETQAVLKPLGGMFAGVPGLSGTTIMGDGRVALILDIGALLERARPAAAA